MNAAAMSTFRMTGDIGYVIGPLALGFIADLYGPVAALLAGAAALVLIGATFGIFASESHRQRKV
jgi:MFS family permease